MKAAIILDFDKTLTTEDQQETIFREYGVENWWVKLEGIDYGLSWMQQFILDIPKHFPDISNKKLEEFGKKVPLEKGIPEWFERIKNYAKVLKIDLEFYIISLGNYHMIKGTGISEYVDHIDAGEFVEKDGVIFKIKTVMTPNLKIKKAKECYKKVGHLTDLSIPEYHILPKNIITIGDGESDADILRHIHSMGGRSIGVYPVGNLGLRDNLKIKLKKDVSLIIPRDYTDNSELDLKIKEYLKKIYENKCDMDFDLVQRFERGQIENKEVKDIVKKHLESCEYCKERLETEII